MPGYSFDCVDFKLAEADFFLEKMETASFGWEINFYFSAFVSASRSVSFAMQAVMADVSGFDTWYSRKQEDFRSDALCRFFVEYRNEVQKTGELPIRGGYSRRDEGGTRKWTYVFGRSVHTGERNVPRDRVDFIHWVMAGLNGGRTGQQKQEDDAILLCRKYMCKIVRLVTECYRDFGSVIDPDKYYTLENLKARGKTLEDVEEDLGFPRAWTAGLGDDETRLKALARNEPRSRIKHLFEKYSVPFG